MSNKFEIEKRIICSKCGRLIQLYRDDAFNPQWSNISIYSGSRKILCGDCCPTPPDFAKKDNEFNKLLKLLNLEQDNE